MLPRFSGTVNSTALDVLEGFLLLLYLCMLAFLGRGIIVSDFDLFMLTEVLVSALLISVKFLVVTYAVHWHPHFNN